MSGQIQNDQVIQPTRQNLETLSSSNGSSMEVGGISKEVKAKCIAAVANEAFKLVALVAAIILTVFFGPMGALAFIAFGASVIASIGLSISLRQDGVEGCEAFKIAFGKRN